MFHKTICYLSLSIMALSLPLLSCRDTVAGDLGNVRKSAKGASSNSDDDDDDKKKSRLRKSQQKSIRDSSKYNRKKSRQKRSHQHDDSHKTSNFLADLILFSVGTPWWGPAAMLGDDRSYQPGFSQYPYEDGHDGYLILSPNELVTDSGFGTRFSTEYGNDFSGLERVGGRLQLDTVSRFGLDTEWNHWREEIAGGHDTLWTGDANLVFRFAQSEKAQFYTGLGLNWLGGGQTDVGFNFTYGFDWFPTDPFVIRSVLDAGTIGDADLYHSKTTVGLVYNHLEVFTGYDILHIGNSNLQGLIAGFTLWW